MSDSSATLAALGRIGIVPVVTVDDADVAGGLGAALVDGGLPCAEITLRTAAGIDAIAEARHSVPGLLLGAGTVLTVDQARRAVDAGAQFLASPGYDDDVVEWARAHDVLILPGVCTPTEMMRARRAGLDAVKFFPAQQAGGTATLRAVSSVFDDLRIVPTGGIGHDDLADYLAVPAVVACGGSWMATSRMLASRNWSGVEAAARAAVDVVRMVRRGGASSGDDGR